MLIDKLSDLKTKITVGEAIYTSDDIKLIVSEITTNLKNDLKKNSVVAVCLSDNLMTFLVSVSIWDMECTIMFINSSNGDDYVDRILDNYKPSYILCEKEGYRSMEQFKRCNVFTVAERNVFFYSCEGNNPQYTRGTKGCIFFSSGTTDVPKAVFRSQHNMEIDAESNIETFDISSRDTLFLAAPLGHVYGLGSGVIPFLLKGASFCFAPPFLSGRGLKRIIENKNITAILSVPMVYQEILNSDTDMSNCRLMLSAGSKLSNTLINDFYKKYGKLINNMYGSSETGAIATLYDSEFVNVDNSNCGRSMKLVEISCNGSKEREDIIKIRSGAIAQGIINGDSVDSIVDADGWFETNDMGYFDSNGCLHIVCRREDMINIGGEKLSPKTIEKIVENDYEQVLVLTESTDNGVVYPVLYIEADEVDFKELCVKLKERLNYRFLPKYIYAYKSFPRNSNGKIDRNALTKDTDWRTKYECH